MQGKVNDKAGNKKNRAEDDAAAKRNRKILFPSPCVSAAAFAPVSFRANCRAGVRLKPLEMFCQVALAVIAEIFVGRLGKSTRRQPYFMQFAGEECGHGPGFRKLYRAFCCNL